MLLLLLLFNFRLPNSMVTPSNPLKFIQNKLLSGYITEIQLHIFFFFFLLAPSLKLTSLLSEPESDHLETKSFFFPFSYLLLLCQSEMEILYME